MQLSVKRKRLSVQASFDDNELSLRGKGSPGPLCSLSPHDIDKLTIEQPTVHTSYGDFHTIKVDTNRSILSPKHVLDKPKMLSKDIKRHRSSRPSLLPSISMIKLADNVY